VKGRVLKSFNNAGCSGECAFTWDGKAENGGQVEEGMYIVQFSNDKNVYTRKIIWMK
jgi:flagellar hook assembly protein FlgD